MEIGAGGNGALKQEVIVRLAVHQMKRMVERPEDLTPAAVANSVFPGSVPEDIVLGEGTRGYLENGFKKPDGFPRQQAAAKLGPREIPAVQQGHF